MRSLVHSVTGPQRVVGPITPFGHALARPLSRPVARAPHASGADVDRRADHPEVDRSVAEGIVKEYEQAT